MSDTVQDYKVNFKVDKALAAINKLKTQSAKLNQAQEGALKRQISLTQKLIRLQGQLGKGGGGGSIPSLPTKIPPKTPSSPIEANSHVIAFQKEQLRLQKEADRLEKQRVDKLKTATNTLKRSVFYQDAGRKAALDTAIATAKTSDALRDQVAEVRKKYREQKRTEKSLERQSFLMRRMTSSSEQFAGNMVSAFAAASGFAGIVKVGQDFESVNNTMLAVSGSTEQAAADFKFAQDQAFRLGLGLKDSAKQYAKMIAAQGELSKQDLNESFLGLAEMSTVLGLSADESGRAFTALTQIMSKNQVMAEELSY